jgi:putative ABC transport system ATP-binding protein
MTLLAVQNVQKIYQNRFGGAKVEALKQVSFTVEKGEYLAIMGESGSGKTTLLNILATLDKPTRGEIHLSGKPMSSLKDKGLTDFRRTHLGFVFQDYNLLDTFSIRDNIVLPLVLAQSNYATMMERLSPIAKKLAIDDILDKFPYEVSGGQKQRTAVARALITQPDLLLADEPTGALDSKSTEQLLSQFNQINEEGQTILMVTHSTKAASHAKRVLFIRDGEVFHQLYRGQMTQDEFYARISDALSALTTGGLHDTREHF